eukprot:1982050-Pleurochrysis_carterae.AAC.1
MEINDEELLAQALERQDAERRAKDATSRRRRTESERRLRRQGGAVASMAAVRTVAAMISTTKTID